MKKIINFIGYSCAGKTTISNLIFEKYSHCFFLAFDKIKWQFSGYERNIHRELIGDIEKNFLSSLLENKKISFIISDFRFKDEKDFELFLKSTKIKKENFINIFLHAPLETRLQRFHERLERCKKSGHKITITNDQLFFKQAAEKVYAPKNSIPFDTSKQSKENILKEIEVFLKTIDIF